MIPVLGSHIAWGDERAGWLPAPTIATDYAQGHGWVAWVTTEGRFLTL